MAKCLRRRFEVEGRASAGDPRQEQEEGSVATAK